MEERITPARKELPEWIVVLMQAYKEYINTKGVKDAE